VLILLVTSVQAVAAMVMAIHAAPLREAHWAPMMEILALAQLTTA
jgi:hypothetical protein